MSSVRNGIDVETVIPLFYLFSLFQMLLCSQKAVREGPTIFSLSLDLWWEKVRIALLSLTDDRLT